MPLIRPWYIIIGSYIVRKACLRLVYYKVFKYPVKRKLQTMNKVNTIMQSYLSLSESVT